MSAGHANGWKVPAAGLAVLAGLCLAAVARGAEIRNVTAKQRYPWNGLVDIRFSVSGIGEGEAWALSLAALEPDSGSVREVSHFRVVRDGTDPDERAVSANGECEVLWDAAADLGEVVCSNMVVQVAFWEHPMFQLWEGGPYWADRNVGAEEPWESGHYFWWGDTTGFLWEDEQWVATDGSVTGYSFTGTNTPTQMVQLGKLQSQGWITEDGVLAPGADPAQVQWGGGWRMPTTQELSALIDNCEWIWTTTNGAKGYVVRGRDGHASASIFLPLAGWGNGTLLDRVGKYGYFWAADPDSSLTNPRSWRLILRPNDKIYMDYFYDRYVGTSCRPVRGGAERQSP